MRRRVSHPASERLITHHSSQIDYVVCLVGVRYNLHSGHCGLRVLAAQLISMHDPSSSTVLPCQASE